MAEAVFRDYDQATLDWEYNNRGKVPDTAECKAAQIAGSDEAKESFHNQLDHRFGSGDTDFLDIYPAHVQPSLVRAAYAGASGHLHQIAFAILSGTR